MLRSLTNYHQEQNISQLSILFSEAAHKRRLLGHTILIYHHKQSIFSLIQLAKHYSSIYEENYLDDDLKSETFALTRGGLIIQIRA